MIETGSAPSALLVDLYELTMLDAYRRHGMADRRATFSLFVRSLPEERNVLVAAGLDDALTWLERLRFDPDDLDALRRSTPLPDETVEWLGNLRFTGTVRAVAEGTPVFAEEPILEVEAPIAEAQIAETFLLNQITVQTTLATKAARCREAAGGRAVVDFAMRRTHGIDAAMKLGRVARLVGLAGTSNVAAADRYGLPASGTMAHSFVQAFEHEIEAFRSFADTYGNATILLVDTYDTPRGVERAIEVAHEMRRAGRAIRGIRLDSGDLAELAAAARRRFDEEGLDDLAIFASGGLDEHAIDALVRAGAPVDGFGVGTALAVSADAPDLESVYKLVAFDGHPVRKTSTGKRSLPGAKQVWRRCDWSGDVIGLADEAAPSPEHRPLLETVMVDGRRSPAGSATLAELAERFEETWAEIPAELRSIAPRDAHPVELSDGLRRMIAELDGV